MIPKILPFIIMTVINDINSKLINNNQTNKKHV